MALREWQSIYENTNSKVKNEKDFAEYKVLFLSLGRISKEIIVKFLSDKIFFWKVLFSKQVDEILTQGPFY